MATDAPVALQKLGNFHFEPGTQHSYSNVNFHVLGRIVEHLTGNPLDRVLKEHIFAPAGSKYSALYWRHFDRHTMSTLEMNGLADFWEVSTAELRPDTNDLPGPCIGYEGIEQRGFFRALNRIEWSRHAGIVASLNDMVSYEQYLDQQRAVLDSAYQQISQAPTFIDGSPAFYGWGLRHAEIAGHNSLGHTGGLQGFRLHRRHIPHARMSAVLMFNHEGDSDTALNYLLEKALLGPETERIEVAPAKGWKGAYFDPEAKLAITVTTGQNRGDLIVNVSFLPEKVKCSTPFEAGSRSMNLRLSDDILTLQRPRENRTITARRMPPPTSKDFLGSEYRSDEIDSVFHVTGSTGI